MKVVKGIVLCVLFKEGFEDILEDWEMTGQGSGRKVVGVS